MQKLSASVKKMIKDGKSQIAIRYDAGVEFKSIILDNNSDLYVDGHKRPWVVRLVNKELLLEKYDPTRRFVTESVRLSTTRPKVINDLILDSNNPDKHPVSWVIQMCRQQWSPLSRYMDSMGYASGVDQCHCTYANYISAVVPIGGELYGDVEFYDGYEVITDGTVEPLDHEIVVKEGMIWKSKTNTMGQLRVVAATYIITFVIHQTSDGEICWYPLVYTGAEAGDDFLISLLKDYQFGN